MSDRPFRFGVTTAFAPTAEAWASLARRAEGLGYATLLVPDTLQTLSPFPALVAAAAATTELRVGTFVLNTPLRAPGAVALEAATVDLLSGGRLELGLGAGRPGGAAEAEQLGLPFGTPGERIRRLADTIRTVKETLDKGDDEPAAPPASGGVRAVQRPHPPILVAGSGRRLLELAAREADTIALGIAPAGTEYDLATKVGELRDVAGERFDQLELSINLAAIGDELPPWLAAKFSNELGQNGAKGAVALLGGTVDDMCDTLRLRRDALGISYISVNAMFMNEFAPVVERLAGR
jgi:probable F420-dependent oxidoreductase